MSSTGFWSRNACRWWRTTASVTLASLFIKVSGSWKRRVCGLRLGLQDEVERGFGGPPHAAEAGLVQHGGESAFASLRAEAEADLLGQRARCADDRGQAVVGPSDRVEVVLEGIAGVALDQEQCAVRGQALTDVAGRADRVTHVVQGVEEAHQVVAVAGEVLGRGHLEGRPRMHTG